MRALVISDIHANANALDSVLSHAEPVDAVWCLGDLVGYGPDPNECIERLQALPNLTCLLGNHDAAATGKLALEGFNMDARASIEWMRKQLTPDSLNFLHSLEPLVEVSNITLAHASPRQPILEYLLDTYSAAENFEVFTTELCFVGHTHAPVIFRQREHSVDLVIPEANTSVELNLRSIANPGSVGQPRDRDPRAAFAVYDDSTQGWHFHRVDYDIADVQARMRAHKLPEKHITRLASGW